MTEKNVYNSIRGKLKIFIFLFEIEAKSRRAKFPTSI